MTQRVRLTDVVRGLGRLGWKAPTMARAARDLTRIRGRSRYSLGQLLEDRAADMPDRLAVAFEDQRLTWAELNVAANRFAAALVGRGVRRGEVVAVMLHNRPELLVVVAAIAKLGAVAALINTAQRGSVLRHSLSICHARRVVADRLLDAVEGAGTDLRAVPFAALREDAASRPPQNPASTRDVRLNDACFYIYTSGTTGLPKASIMSQMRFVKAGALFGRTLLDLAPEDVLYTPLPLYHNMALTVSWASCLATGAALAIRERFSASEFWSDCRQHGATAFTYIGELPRYLLNTPPGPWDRDHGVRRCAGVGMRPDVWPDFKSRFGLDAIYETYTASESNTAFVNLLDIEGTIGFSPTPHKLVRYDVEADQPVRDSRGRLIEVETGEVGLLVSKVTRLQTFDGYTDPAATEKKLLRDAFRKGDVWVDSGDLLRKIGWGHAEFVDRVGDTFRWKGENVSTGEVEKIVNTFAGVAESTVYGVRVPNADGRAGMAALVPAGPLDVQALHAHLTRELPAYAIPVFLRLVDALDATGTYKHQKGGLRKQGMDPGEISDPLYVRIASGYEPLTAAAHAEIVSGRVRL